MAGMYPYKLNGGGMLWPIRFIRSALCILLSNSTLPPLLVQDNTSTIPAETLFVRRSQTLVGTGVQLLYHQESLETFRTFFIISNHPHTLPPTPQGHCDEWCVCDPHYAQNVLQWQLVRCECYHMYNGGGEIGECHTIHKLHTRDSKNWTLWRCKLCTFWHNFVQKSTWAVTLNCYCKHLFLLIEWASLCGVHYTY